MDKTVVPLIKPEAKSDVPEGQKSLNVQCFVHKGELVITFSEPVNQWFMQPETVRKFAQVFAEAAQRLDEQQAAGATKQ